MNGKILFSHDKLFSAAKEYLSILFPSIYELRIKFFVWSKKIFVWADIPGSRLGWTIVGL